MAHALQPPAPDQLLRRLVGGWLIPTVILVLDALLALRGLVWPPLWPLTVAAAIWATQDYRTPAPPARKALR
jgi:hypothetical protein